MAAIAWQRFNEADRTMQNQLNKIVEAIKVLEVFVATHALTEQKTNKLVMQNEMNIIAVTINLPQF